MGDAERDQVEGIRGYRRAVKKIRCALQLTAGGLGLEKRKELDAQWASLARRLGVMRDRDARDKKINEIISLLPVHAQEGARLAWVGVAHSLNFLEARNATAPKIGTVISSHDHREVLEGLASDTERMILATEAIRFSDLSPQMVAGSVEHLWNRAQRQARKSWDGRDQAWLHALRKRVQRAHIAFRLLRAQGGEGGLEVEKRLDAAASVGLNVAINLGTAASTAPYASGMSVDSSTVLGTATLPLQVMGVTASPDNDVTSTARPAELLVRINTHAFNAAGLAGV